MENAKHEEYEKKIEFRQLQSIPVSNFNRI